MSVQRGPDDSRVKSRGRVQFSSDARIVRAEHFIGDAVRISSPDGSDPPRVLGGPAHLPDPP